MITKTIRLARIDDVKTFVGAAQDMPFDIEIVSGKYVVDGKSIMGIFSLDLSKELTMTLNTDGAQAFLERIQKLLVEG